MAYLSRSDWGAVPPVRTVPVSKRLKGVCLHYMGFLAERHGLQIVTEYEEKVGTSASHIKNHDRPQAALALELLTN